MLSQGKFEVDFFDYSEEVNKPIIYDEQNDLAINKTPHLPTLNPHSHTQPHKTSRLRNAATNKVSNPNRKINTYPTKNCLALFKSAHFAYLLRQGIRYQDFWQMVALKQKQGAARQDFVLIYKIKKLRGVWGRMLREKFIFRYLMISRALSMQKRIYQSRIKVLEKAFEKLQFQRLNEK